MEGPYGRPRSSPGLTSPPLLEGNGRFVCHRGGDWRTKIWEQLEDGEVSADLVWTAYRENLDIVLFHVETLCEELAGKTVVTSDHGNLIGEFARPFPTRQYGHPPEIHTTKLLGLPWLEVESGTRREIVSEPPVGSETESDEGERLERLSALGYR